MPFGEIPINVWRAAWAELEQVVIGGGSSSDIVWEARPNTSHASHWLASGNSIVLLKAVTRLSFIRFGMAWDGPHSRDVANFLTANHFPVIIDKQLSEGNGGPDPADVLGQDSTPQSPDYETVRRLARPEQTRFRATLIRAYGPRCAISGCEVEAVLDACHILSHSDGGAAEAANGLLLRRDLHSLFDLGLIAVDPEELSWRFHDDLREHYRDLCDGRDGPDFETGDTRLGRLSTHWHASQL